jgi:hypothetical protein
MVMVFLNGAAPRKNRKTKTNLDDEREEDGESLRGNALQDVER